MTPRQVYEFYCQRGEVENRIKELKLALRLACTPTQVQCLVA